MKKIALLLIALPCTASALTGPPDSGSVGDCSRSSGSSSASFAFHSIRDGDWEIFVMDADGSNQRQLTNNSSDDSFPAWRPVE